MTTEQQLTVEHDLSIANETISSQAVIFSQKNP